MDQCLECPVGYVAETPGSTSCTECVPDGSTSSKVETHDTNAVRAWGSPMLQPIVGEVKDRSMMTSISNEKMQDEKDQEDIMLTNFGSPRRNMCNLCRFDSSLLSSSKLKRRGCWNTNHCPWIIQSS